MKSCVALGAFLLLVACAEAPVASVEDRTTVSPAFAAAQVVDVAVLPPTAETPDQELIRGRIRHTAHTYMIDEKNYAVPEDRFVDQAVTTLPGGSDPGQSATAAGSDAALLVSITQWDTDDLVPKGRIHAGGTVSLYGKDRSVYWERTFRNKMVLADRNVTAANRGEVVDTMVRDLIRDLLSTMPPKPAR